MRTAETRAFRIRWLDTPSVWGGGENATSTFSRMNPVGDTLCLRGGENRLDEIKRQLLVGDTLRLVGGENWTSWVAQRNGGTPVLGW